MKPGKDELVADEPGVDAADEGTDDAINDETPTELPIEETDLLLVGARLVEPPPLPPPQANSNVHATNSSVRPRQSILGRAIAVLISNPILLTLINTKHDSTASIKHSHYNRRAQN